VFLLKLLLNPGFEIRNPNPEIPLDRRRQQINTLFLSSVATRRAFLLKEKRKKAIIHL